MGLPPPTELVKYLKTLCTTTANEYSLITKCSVVICVCTC